MNGVVIGALMALGMMQQQTDTVFPAAGAQRLDVEVPGGSIAVTGWDRNEIRVQASHSRRTHIEIQRSGDRVSVEAEADRGPVTIVDYTISVPRTLSVNLEGMYADMTVDGVNGDVDAETLQGDVTVKGGTGSVKASSTTGKILVQGAQGKVDVESTASEIRLVDVAGDVTGESVGGSIVFENAHPTSVDVGTTGGRIRYEGSLDPKGSYYFGTFGGSVTIVVPEGTGASLSLSTVHSSAMTNLGGEMQRFKSGDRHHVDVNGGGAVVEIESFGGRIAVVRKGTEDTVGGAAADELGSDDPAGLGRAFGSGHFIRPGDFAGLNHLAGLNPTAGLDRLAGLEDLAGLGASIQASVQEALQQAGVGTWRDGGKR